MKIGNIIKWTNNDFLERYIFTKITDKKYYNTFEEYLKRRFRKLPSRNI